MKPRAENPKRLPSKIATGFLVLSCLLLGVVGVVLPIIPGLLFLALAGLIVAKEVPWMERRLRRNGAIGKHLDRANRFTALTLGKKVQVITLICVKTTIDGVALVYTSVSKLLHFAARKRQYGR